MAAEIPAIFDQPDAAFVLLPTGIKYPPVEREWQKKPHTFAEATAHMGNVGAIAGYGYIGLDLDTPDAFNGLELPATTSWETRPGRYGMWFKCSDVTPELLAQYGKKADFAQFHIYKDGVHVGEIKLQNSYQTIPNSHKFVDPNTGDDVRPGKGDRVDYKLLDSSPPATISLSKLLADLQAIGITFNMRPKASRLESNAARLEDIGKKARQRRIETYAAAALQDEARILENTKADSENRNNQLFKSSANMGEFVAAGVLSEADVILALSEAAENTGLGPDEIRKTIISGLNTGKKHPREIPESPTNKASAEDAPTTEARYKQILDSIKAKPSILTGNQDVLIQLAILKTDDPIGFDLFVNDIKKAKIGIKVDTITSLVNACVERLKKSSSHQKKDIEHDPDAISSAHEILDHGDPLQAHLDHVKERVCGGEKPARLVTLSSYSAYLSNNERLYADIVGSPQSGKSTITTAVLEGFPEENVINASEASPKSLYYLAQQQPERLKDAVIYIDDGRPEHIPVLKTFRNEGNVRPTNLTVSDGVFLELVVQYRPVVLASSVTPLRDMEGQATSRAFL